MAAVTFFQGLGPQNLIYSNLQTVDLLHLSQTCRTIRESVLDTCFSIQALLSPFFSSNVDAFRRIQEETGMLISGSTALLFFLRTSGAPETYRYGWQDFQVRYYPSLTSVHGKPVPANERDLDLYVEHRYALQVAKFLEMAGYTFSPRKAQEEDWRKQLIPKAEATVEWKAHRYLGRGIQDVLDFYHEKEDAEANKGMDIKGDDREKKPTLKGTKIQLITAKKCPMDVILTFHSTCVMNVISSKAAYSLFPHATFVDHNSLDIETSGLGQEAARRKYASRGWEMHPSLHPNLALDPRSDFCIGFRWVGDRRTWTIPLSPRGGAGFDLVELNSFGLEYNILDLTEVTGANIVYELCENEEWKNVYALGDRPRCQIDWKRIQEDDYDRFDLKKRERDFYEAVVLRRSLREYDPTFVNRATVGFQ